MKIEIFPGKLKGVIDAIPSKSHAHRILIAQKLAEIQGQKTGHFLQIPTFSEDIEATKECLAELDKEIPVLNCHESGSTLRFLLPTVMAVRGEAVFCGSGKLPRRPISPLKEEMEKHGCQFFMEEERAVQTICRIRGKLTSGRYELPGNISSQFITGLLYALPLLEGDSILTITTKLESAGYVDMTRQVLERFGIRMEEQKTPEGWICYQIPGGQTYREPEGMAMEGDWSNAAFWLACGALGGEVTCRGLQMDSAQRDKEIVTVLREMGAEITQDEQGITCRSGALKGVKTSVLQTPDLVPVMATVMALSEGTSEITDAGRLRIKESDRLETVEEFLRKLGADVNQLEEGMLIHGEPRLAGGTVCSHNDHRIAMAAAVASCGCVNPVVIEDAGAVRKSYPGFYEDFQALGGKVRIIPEEENW